jgi:hypothetical protein
LTEPASHFKGHLTVVRLLLQGLYCRLSVILTFTHKESSISIRFLVEQRIKARFDDKTTTLHLKRLNKLLMAKASKEEINLYAEYFARSNTKK